jgi:hypothetical protein
MNIILSEEFKAYRKENNISAITANAASSGGSCCRIIVPKVKVGEPTVSWNEYDRYEVEGLNVFISKNLPLENTVTFSYKTFLGKSMIDMQGFEVNHYSNI